jgi:S1-C subfamily serine protease
MRIRPRIAGVVLLSLAASLGCRRDVAKLDQVGKMAYGVKPAVVRISAYATAQFRYTPDAIDAVATQLSADGHRLEPRDKPAGDVALETGAGGSGSGFIVHPDGWIMTSGHVVAPTYDRKQLDHDLLRNGAIAALVKHFQVQALRSLYRDEELDRYIKILADAGALQNIAVVNEVELSNGEKLPFQIARFSPTQDQGGADLALIRVARKNLPSLALGDSDSTRVGQSIWSVGYPAVASSTDDVIGGWLSRDSDLEATFNPGIITALKSDSNNTPVFQTNVAIYRGNSGGPAVNPEGKVIGISTWGHTSAESIKFLVPIDVAKKLLAETKVPANIDGEFNVHYHAALEAAYDGEWLEAKRNLVHATVLYPNSPDLIRFRRDTDRAVKAMPLWQLHPGITTLFVVGISLVLALGTTALVRSRRPQIPKELLTATTSEVMVAPGNGSPGGKHQMLGKFTILNGVRAGEKLGLGGSGIRIGRESAICEIVLENPKVSRLHAEVVSIDGKVLLIDRNSSNGTYVNDQKIDKRFLKDGDIIYFGGRNAVAVAFHA